MGERPSAERLAEDRRFIQWYRNNGMEPHWLPAAERLLRELDAVTQERDILQRRVEGLERMLPGKIGSGAP